MIDRDLCLSIDADTGSCEFLESVFRLVPKYKYDAQNALKSVTWESTSASSRFKEEEARDRNFDIAPYRQAALAEKDENQSEFLRMLSKQVTYGQVCHLLGWCNGNIDLVWSRWCNFSM